MPYLDSCEHYKCFLWRPVLAFWVVLVYAQGMAIWRCLILQKESATGQEINILKHPHEIAVSSKSVRQGEQSCWIPVPVAGSVQVGRVERPPGAQSRWCLVLLGPGWGQWFFLQRAVLRMASASELFWVKQVLKIFAVVFILPVFMVNCSFVKRPIEKHLRGVGSAGERRMRLRWQQWLLLEGSELSSEELAGGKQMSALNSGSCCLSYP